MGLGRVGTLAVALELSICAVALENEEWRSNVRRVSAKVATFSGFGSRDAVYHPGCSSWRGVQTMSDDRALVLS